MGNTSRQCFSCGFFSCIQVCMRKRYARICAPRGGVYNCFAIPLGRERIACDSFICMPCWQDLRLNTVIFDFFIQQGSLYAQLFCSLYFVALIVEQGVLNQAAFQVFDFLAVESFAGGAGA